MADTKNFKIIPISELRIKLTTIKRQVQLGYKRVVVTCYGEVLGFLLPLKDLDSDDSIPIEKTLEMPLTQFREKLTEAGELIGEDVDCIYLTFHTRKIMAFVSSRFTYYLSLPVLKNIPEMELDEPTLFFTISK